MGASLAIRETCLHSRSFGRWRLLISSDLWAAYVDMRRKGLGARYPLRLLGFARARAERTVGWVPVRDLFIKVSAAVVRMLAAASSNHKKEPNPLLVRALRQMVRNFEGSRDRPTRSSTWWGRTMKIVRGVWPQFQLTAQDSGGLVPLRDSSFEYLSSEGPVFQ